MAHSALMCRSGRLGSRPGPTRYTAFALALTGLSLCLSGCVHTDLFTSKSQKVGPPVSPISEISMIWKGLAVTQDSVNGGRPLPGIAGRMYLMGPDLGTPRLCDGTVQVEMSLPDDKGEMKLLERWQIDSTTLQRLARKDVIGQGYTLFLPWSSYHPSTTQAQMRVVFTPKGANPVYGPATMVNIRPPAPIPIQEQKYVAPTPTPVR